MKKLIIPVLAIASLYSCSNSDDNSVITNPDEKYLNGVFVSNEGGFTKSNASVSHINGDLSTITNDIFKTVNGKGLGDVAQSMVVTDKYVFVVVNNSNTIEVVNKKTFKSVYTISQNLNSPRYAVIKNNKLYVTSLKDAKVNVYNAENFAFVKAIDLDYTAENIVATNDYVYAANGFYSTGKLVEVIDPNTDTNTKDLAFDNAVSGITTNGQFVYVLESNDTASKISQVQGSTKGTSVALTQASARNIVIDGSTIYYTAATGIYKLNNSLSSAGTKLFDVTSTDQYSLFYGFNVINGTIFTADANGFTNNSTITLFKEDGTKLKEFTAGIATNGFYKF